MMVHNLTSILLGMLMQRSGLLEYTVSTQEIEEFQKGMRELGAEGLYLGAGPDNTFTVSIHFEGLSHDA